MSVLGVSGEVLSLAIQILALAASFILGTSRCRRALLLSALAIGVVANIVGQVILAGGGPGACAGMVMLPLFCAFASLVGKGCRWVVVGRHETPHKCHA